MVKGLIGVPSDVASVISGAGYLTTGAVAVVKALIAVTKEGAAVVQAIVGVATGKAAVVFPMLSLTTAAPAETTPVTAKQTFYSSVRIFPLFADRGKPPAHLTAAFPHEAGEF